MVHFRAGVRGVRINVSPVVAIDPPLILIITFVAAGVDDPILPWPVVMAMLTSVVAGSYLSWGVLYRAGLLCGFRARAKGASDKT
jgi:hypothetical protein